MGGIGSLRIGSGRRSEAAGKPSPSDALFVQQVADVLSGHFDRQFARDRAALIIAAIIEVRILVRRQGTGLNGYGMRGTDRVREDLWIGGTDKEHVRDRGGLNRVDQLAGRALGAAE